MRDWMNYAALTVTLSFASTASAADEYKIKIDRPFHVGDTFNITQKVTSKITRKIDHDGQTKNEDDGFECALDGVETIEVVDEKAGQPTKVSVKVISCTKDGKELVAAGGTIEAEQKDGKQVTTVNGDAPDKENAGPLGELVDTHNPDHPTSDQVHGTDKPQPVGGTWKVDADAMAKSISQGPFKVDPKDVKGDCALTGVQKVDGIDTETVTTKITASAAEIKMKNGATAHDLAITSEMEDSLPVDPASTATAGKYSRTLSVKIDYPAANVELTSVLTEEYKYSPVKK